MCSKNSPRKKASKIWKKKLKKLSRNSSNSCELLEVDGRELVEFVKHQIALRLNRRVDPDLSHVGVAPILVITYHSHLDHEGSNGILADVLDGNDDPSRRLAQVDDFDFVEVVEVRSSSDADSWRRVGLVELVIAVNVDLADGRLSGKLNINQVWQLAIWLPISLHRIVSKLFHAKS